MMISRHGDEFTITDGKRVHGIPLRVEVEEQADFQRVIDDLVEIYRSSPKLAKTPKRHLLRAYVGKCKKDERPSGWAGVFRHRDAIADRRIQEEGIAPRFIESLVTPARVALAYACSDENARKILRQTIDAYPEVGPIVTTPSGQLFKGEEHFGWEVGPIDAVPHPSSRVADANTGSGNSDGTTTEEVVTTASPNALCHDAQSELSESGYFDKESHRDEPHRVYREIEQRRGQKKFRDALLKAYERKCAITGCNVEEALEAAHIESYRESRLNHVTNGLLLRSDIHTLFDLGLISINPAHHKIEIADKLADLRSHYSSLARNELRLPAERSCHPDRKSLEKHYLAFIERPL